MKKFFAIIVLMFASLSALAQPNFIENFKQSKGDAISIRKNVIKSSGKKGDVNGDGVVNAADIVEIVNIMMNQSANDEDDSGITGDYIRVTLNGHTYSDKILKWHYAQVDPVGRDDNNKPLTLTYDMYDRFEDYGFSFMFGVVHFSRKNELLASSPGTYGCSESILSSDYYRNLTFCSTLDIDYDEYKWVSGTHEVKSIKEVNGDVQIEGAFTSTFIYEGDSKIVNGDYRITIP